MVPFECHYLSIGAECTGEQRYERRLVMEHTLSLRADCVRVCHFHFQTRGKTCSLKHNRCDFNLKGPSSELKAYCLSESH